MRVRTNFQTTSWNQVEENSLNSESKKKLKLFHRKWKMGFNGNFLNAELAFCVQEHAATP